MIQNFSKQLRKGLEKASLSSQRLNKKTGNPFVLFQRTIELYTNYKETASIYICLINVS